MKFLKWLKANQLAFIYFGFAMLIEMTVVYAVEGTFFIQRPYIFIGFVFAATALVLLLPNNRTRLFVYGGLLIVQAVIDLVFAVIYDMTGQYFDLGMLSLRNDAFGTLESIPVNPAAFFLGLFFCILYFVYGLRITYEERHLHVGRWSAFFYALASITGVSVMIGSLASFFPADTDKYEEMRNGNTTGLYSAYGMIGNLFGEISKSISKDEVSLSEEDLESFIYNYQEVPAKTEYFGVSKGKNVVTVLAESFEWYAFLKNEEYPNALDLTDEELATLYPNLTKFYNESVVMTNFHSREKTDISETLSIMGSYPTDAYVNYDYADNAMPNTLPNILKIEAGEENLTARSFHNGYKSFYNREEAHVTFGFEGLTDMYDMEKMAMEGLLEGEKPTFINYDDEGERNLDSEMIETAKDLMFPADGSRFYTYVTTITMHGVYYSRENLQEEKRRIIETLGMERLFNIAEKDGAEVLLYYMITALEFDDAIGAMMNDLEKKGLLDDTVIVLFGDHNAYYQQLSNYVKNIDDYDTKGKFTDLYNVPFMIYDTDLIAEMETKGESRIIDKFTCTADIVPTLLDLLGIQYFGNLYYGHSVFSKDASVLYSRAYGNFIYDGVVSRSVNNPFYIHKSVTEKALSDYKKEGDVLVEKIKYCDYVFQKNYFATKNNLAQFQEEMKKLNGWD
ncbi:MAG: LTA synthase family protein [Clostridiales bacterium]|nr:LTA synthase family protein [Clostridiales bacterium]